MYDLRRAHYDVQALPGYSKLGGEEIDDEAEAVDNEAAYNVEVAPPLSKKPTGKKQRVTRPDGKKVQKARCQSYLRVYNLIISDLRRA